MLGDLPGQPGQRAPRARPITRSPYVIAAAEAMKLFARASGSIGRGGRSAASMGQAMPAALSRSDRGTPTSARALTSAGS